MTQTNTRSPVGNRKSAREPPRRRPRLKREVLTPLLLLAYGLMFAIVGGLTLADDFKGTGNLPMISDRVKAVRGELSAQAQGAPPFTVVASGVDFRDARPS